MGLPLLVRSINLSVLENALSANIVVNGPKETRTGHLEYERGELGDCRRAKRVLRTHGDVSELSHTFSTLSLKAMTSRSQCSASSQDRIKTGAYGDPLHHTSRAFVRG